MKRGLTAGDLCRAGLIAPALLAARTAITAVGFARVRGACGRLPRGRAATEPLAVAFHLARLVDGTARRWPVRANCLARSVVLWAWLRVRGVDSELWFGVRRSAPPSDDIEAHAWVAIDGTVVNDTADVAERYAPFPEPVGR